MKVSIQNLFLVLAGAGLLAMPLSARAQFTYVTNSSTITITSYTGSGGAVAIPAVINGLPVVEIGNFAFSGATMASVTIPDSVTTIDYEAFSYCGYLTNVTIGNNVTGISSFAFDNCGSLTSVTIPDSVTYIASFAFSGCTSMTNIIIGNSVNNVGQDCFTGDSSLESVTFGTSFASIQEYAFYQCSALTSLYFKGNAPSYGSDVFDYDGTPTVYYVPVNSGWGTNFDGLPTAPWILYNYITNNGAITITGYKGWGGPTLIPSTINGLPVVTIGDGAFIGGGAISSLTIPDSVTNIEELGIFGCENMTNVVIGNGVITIGEFAFDDCWHLTSVTIPASVISVDGTAFVDCSYLNSITVNAQNPVFSSTNGGLFDKSQATLLFYPEGATGDFTVPGGVTTIGTFAFADDNLNGITIPASVTNIEPYAFSGCLELSSVTISNGVINIGDWAFTGCWNLGGINIPASVTSIGTGVFSACPALSAITVDALNPAYSGAGGVLFDKNQTTLVQFPGGMGGNYTISNSVTSIADYAFASCRAISSVTIPDGVTNIGDWAFDNCTLSSVTIPDSVISIGDSCFYDCTSLTNVTIGSVQSEAGFKSNTPSPGTPDDSGGVSIGIDAFGDCTSLSAITVDSQNSSYTSVDGVLFDKNQTTLIQCPAGKAGAYSIPNGIANIGSYAFDTCVNLSSVTIPGSVTNIGNYAFTGCRGLTGIYFQGSPPILGYEGVFPSAGIATVYYLPGTGNWLFYFGGLPTAPWLPQVLTSKASFGVRTNQFGFNISWSSGQAVVVEACTDLANPVWLPIQTNTLTSPTSYFSDPDWKNHPSRFYRLHSP